MEKIIAYVMPSLCFCVNELGIAHIAKIAGKVEAMIAEMIMTILMSTLVFILK